MAPLEILFDVPEWIVRGLESGQLQRVGGVIVNVASRQVVTWLRDGAVLDHVKDHGVNALSKIVNVTRTAVSVGDSGQTIAVLASLTVTGQIINLALTSASLYGVSKRLDRLSEEVSKLGETIRAEFTQDRDIRFKVALQAARDVYETNNAIFRDSAVNSAIDGLYEAREHFLADFQKVMKTESNDEKLLIAQQLLIRALYAEISRIRCYLATNDLELARQRLIEDKPRFKECSRLLIKAWIGKYPAAFFHKDVPPQDLERFIQIQRWLYEDDPFSRADDMKIMFKILNDLRGDFWNTAVLQDENTDLVKQITSRLPLKRTNERAARLANKLAQAEVLIENYQRLEGFELELRSMRLSFDEWRDLIKEDDLQAHGFGIVVDTEAIANLRQARKKLQQ